MIIETIDPQKFIVYKDEPNTNTKSILGIPRNKIIEIPDFVTSDTAAGMINYFESYSSNWDHIAFYGSTGMGLAPDDPNLKNYGLEPYFFEKIKNKYQESVEFIFGRKVRPNTSHAQKWVVGGFAAPHSDNSDFEGTPNSFQINKYVAILYLNDDYEGGELYFPEHSIEFKPRANSLILFPGGVENIHGVKEITSGTRYTMVSFWDFADLDYSEELKAQWEEELTAVREEQARQRAEWDKGNKYA
jgi:hypothetical protein